MRYSLIDARLPTAIFLVRHGTTESTWTSSNPWLTEYAVERPMNTLNHFKVTIEGIELHLSGK